jgi:hypothetical protein
VVESLELFVGVVLDDDAAALAALAHSDASAEGAAEIGFGGFDVGIAENFAPHLGGTLEAANEFFGLADVEALTLDALEGGHLGLGAGQGEEGAGVAFGDAAVDEGALEGGRQAEEAEGVSDGNAAAAGALGDLGLGEAVVLDEALVGAGLFEGVEVVPLDVFDQGELEGLAVGGFGDHDRNLADAGKTGGLPAALADDEAEAAAFGDSDDEGLNNAVLADGGGEGFEAVAVEVLARLLGVGVDGVDIDLADAGGLGGGRKEGIETATEGAAARRASWG